MTTRHPLRDALRALRETTPNLRTRDAAQRLGVGEAALVALDSGGSATRLRADCATVLEALPTLGRVMALTRNEAIVSEVDGTYAPPHFEGHAGQVVGEGIDLRVFPRVWRHAWAVRTETPRGTLRSVQVFDASGDAVHKVYLRGDESVGRFEDLAARLAHEDQGPDETFAAAPSRTPERPDEAIDRAGLLEAWRALRDTHDFHPMLGRFGVSRTQALRLAEGHFAERLPADSLRALLDGAASSQTAIMVFVGNPGVIQIRSGAVKRVVDLDGWLNVLDRGFNLHVHTASVVDAWRVRKPSHGRTVTSLELFDAQGTNVALVFGQREDGAWDPPAWRALIDGLPSRAAPVAAG